MGEDPKGKEYRAQAELLVLALIEYKDKNGYLPDSLNDLVPLYVKELPEVVSQAIYVRKEGGLIYTYSPTWPKQGRTSCSTNIGSGEWDCHGYI